jgi:hypothetical protein
MCPGRFVPSGPRTLPRSGYTEQHRVLTLGQVVSTRCPEKGTRRWAGGGFDAPQNSNIFEHMRRKEPPEVLYS